MRDSIGLKCAIIFLISFFLVAFGSVMFLEWLDYKKSTVSTPQIQYITVPQHINTARPDTIIMGSPEYYKQINASTLIKSEDKKGWRK